MSQFPHELIRQVQISTRAAAGLSDYDPFDPNLPALPPLSATIAASDPSSPHLRCKSCKGKLLGSESIICVYCGHGRHYDVVPDPICFTSTIGYQWLLRSLRLDGSEMIDRANINGQDQGQSSPKALTPLSNFLDFKIPWQAETEKEDTSFSVKPAEESVRSFSLAGVAPDKFFLKSNRNLLFDTAIEQPIIHNHSGTTGGKDVAAIDNQDLFNNVQSSQPAESFSRNKADNAFSGWAADFQSADSENQHGDFTPADHFTGFSANSGSEFQDPKSLDNSRGLEVDLSAHIDSVFGPQKDLADVKPKDDPAASPALDDWNSDDMWNNLSSNVSKSASGFDSTLSTEVGPQKDLADVKPKDDPVASPALDDWNSDDIWNNLSSNVSKSAAGFDSTLSTNVFPKSDNTPRYSEDQSSGVALFEDFQLQTMTSEHLSSGGDLFENFQLQTNTADVTGTMIMNEELKTIDEDSFDEWSDFAGSTSLQDPSQNAWTGSDYQVSTSNEKSSEIDLFSFVDNNVEGGDFGSLTQPYLFITSTNNGNAPAEVNPIMSGNLASDWLNDASSPSQESGQAANSDEVKKLISQMHDLSFMLETDLSIPSDPDTRNLPPKD